MSAPAQFSAANPAVPHNWRASAPPAPRPEGDTAANSVLFCGNTVVPLGRIVDFKAAFIKIVEGWDLNVEQSQCLKDAFSNVAEIVFRGADSLEKFKSALKDEAKNLFCHLHFIEFRDQGNANAATLKLLKEYIGQSFVYFMAICIFKNHTESPVPPAKWMNYFQQVHTGKRTSTASTVLALLESKASGFPVAKSFTLSLASNDAYFETLKEYTLPVNKEESIKLADVYNLFCGENTNGLYPENIEDVVKHLNQSKESKVDYVANFKCGTFTHTGTVRKGTAAHFLGFGVRHYSNRVIRGFFQGNRMPKAHGEIYWREEGKTERKCEGIVENEKPLGRVTLSYLDEHQIQYQGKITDDGWPVGNEGFTLLQNKKTITGTITFLEDGRKIMWKTPHKLSKEVQEGDWYYRCNGYWDCKVKKTYSTNSSTYVDGNLQLHFIAEAMLVDSFIGHYTGSTYRAPTTARINTYI